MQLGFRNIDKVCSAVALDQERPMIDLSRVTFIEPFAIVYLGMSLRHYNARGKFFDLLFPGSPDVRVGS